MPFDLDEGEPSESYLNIFRYVTNEIDKMHNGHLEVNAPITGYNLGLPGNFKLADFDTLGDFIYVLDHTQGVIFFRYMANKMVNVRHHLNDAKSYAKRWGIAVNFRGSVV